MVCLSVPPKRFFFFLFDCVFFTPKSTTTDISFESKFAAAMLCFIHDDCVSFRWRGFSRGWLWVSLSFCHGKCANTGCTADIGCLFILYVCCNNAVIGVGANLNLFAKYSAKFRRAITASKQFFGRCFSCKSLGLALHYVSVSSLHFVANPFAARARVRVWYCWQRICIRRERTSWTCLVSFLHSCGCVAQAVLSASRNDLVLIFFAWVFFTCVQQPLRCLRT